MGKDSDIAEQHKTPNKVNDIHANFDVGALANYQSVSNDNLHPVLCHQNGTAYQKDGSHSTPKMKALNVTCNQKTSDRNEKYSSGKNIIFSEIELINNGLDCRDVELSTECEDPIHEQPHEPEKTQTEFNKISNVIDSSNNGNNETGQNSSEITKNTINEEELEDLEESNEDSEDYEIDSEYFENKEQDQENPAQESTESRETIIDRIKNKPAILTPIGISLLIFCYAFSFFFSDSETNTEQKSSNNAANAGFPTLEMPEGIGKQLTADDIKRSFYYAGQKRKKGNPDFSNASHSTIQKPPLSVSTGQHTSTRKQSSTGKHKNNRGGRKTKRIKNAKNHRGAGFYKSGVVMDSYTTSDQQNSNTSTKGFNIVEGTIINVKLKIGVRTDYTKAPAIARVQKAVKINRKVIVPKGSVLKGQFSCGDNRVYINFSSIKINGQKHEIDGYAVTKSVPGVPARLVSGSRRNGGQEAIKKGSLRTAGSITSLITGASVAGDLVRNVADEGI